MSSLSELEELQDDLRKSNANGEKLLRFLRLVRELKVRQSEAVALYGMTVLSKHRSLLSEEELWLLHEQVAVACMDVGQIEAAASLVRALAKRFPDSVRANRLKGMYWEAQGHYQQAEEIYKTLLEENPSNESVHKRLCALERSRGNLAAAAEALRKYLDTWGNDREAWEELAELYLEMLMYRQALFCYEELLMHAPAHIPFLVRYADILYTLGGNSNLQIARSYYSRAVQLSGGSNARALWGVMACCSNTTEKIMLQDSRTRAAIELPELTARALLQLYKQDAPSKVQAVETVLEASLPPAS